MLSIKTIKSAGHALQYYRDIINYYAKDVANVEDKSQWYGKGAEILGLSGNVGDKEFEALLKGCVEDQKLGRNEAGEIKHRPGYDLTFSAPKSVSIMAEVIGDKRLDKAHDEAVKKTLNVIERNHIYTRKTSEGVTELVKTGNLVTAMFEENTSRELDPQKHTHCVVMNMSKVGDKWMSIESKPIFEVQKFYGQVYRSFLAKKIGDIGYDIEITGKESLFEIKGVPKDLMKEFSQRRAQILEALGNYEHVNSKIIENVALSTRRAKKTVDSDELKEIWQSLSNQRGFSTETAINTLSGNKENIKKSEIIENPELQSKKNIIEKLSDKYEEFCQKFEYKAKKAIGHFSNHDDSPIARYGRSARRAVEYGVAHLSERASVWSEKDLYIAAMHFATKNLSYENIEKEIKEMKEAGYLISGKNERMLTTSEAIHQEKEIIKTMKQGQGATNQICSKTHVAERLKAWNSELNSSQRKAVELILCSKDVIVGVNGYAGTGKTYMLEKVKDIAGSKGYELIGMAASASAANTLEKESGIKSQTIHKFLYKYKRLLDNTSNGVINHQYRFELRNKMLIIDEASLASTKQLGAICKIARELFVKVALIGDDKQLKAVEAGKPYQELQKHGMQTAIMNKIIRQKNPELKEAVYNSLNGAIDSAFKKIAKDIYEVQDKVKDKKDGIVKMASIHWVTLDDKKREKTLITAASNEIREGINNEIRKYLKFENKLKGEEYKHVILQNKSLTKSEKCFSGNYKTNDVVLFNNEYKKLGIKPGEHLSVFAIEKNNLIILKNKHGKIIKWNPEYTGGNREGAIEIYQKKEIKLQQGDIIKWTKNSKENAAIINSESAKIISIDKNTVMVETAQKNRVSLNIKKDENILKHIDYGYASTVHNAQGKTYENVIGAIESKHPHLTNQPMFYVTLSRAKNQAILITDDKRQLSQTVKNNTGYRISALEHLAQKDKLELNQMNKTQVIKEEAGIMKIEPAKFKFRV